MTQTANLTITVPAFRSPGRPFGPIRLYQDQADAIDAIAEAHGMNTTDAFRQLVDLGLKAMRKQKATKSGK